MALLNEKSHQPGAPGGGFSGKGESPGVRLGALVLLSTSARRPDLHPGTDTDAGHAPVRLHGDKSMFEMRRRVNCPGHTPGTRAFDRIRDRFGRWIPASMENPLTRCFGWIPAFAGMTGSDDSNTRTLSMFLPRQRGQIPWPWPACAGMTGFILAIGYRHSRASGNPPAGTLSRGTNEQPLPCTLVMFRLIRTPMRLTGVGAHGMRHRTSGGPLSSTVLPSGSRMYIEGPLPSAP